MRRVIRKTGNGTQAFTLLEVMIAISIFSLLMLYVSQFMRSEIHVFQSVSRQNEVEQKARTAMMHILDEVRLNRFTYYQTTANSQGIYSYENAAAALAKEKTNSKCLIFIKLQPSSVIPSVVTVFFDKTEGKLWYQKDNGSRYLIADEILHLSIDGDSSLVKIDIRIGGNNGPQPYELLTWVRLN